MYKIHNFIITNFMQQLIIYYIYLYSNIGYIP